MSFVWFLTVFLVLFPKGGIKLGVLPLTWGYMFMAVTTPPLLVVRLLSFDLRFPVRIWAVVAGLIPIQLLCIYAMVFYGFQNLAFASSTLTGLFFLPWIFLLIYPPFLRNVDGERFARYFRFCILGAAMWGIFLFFYHPLMGRYVEIPYLTVNVDDYGQLEETKHIARGLFFKLISTYNNGNLYGVATLILLPLYNQLEKVRWRRWVVKLALLLTLSRTVWAGLVAAELIPVAALLLRQYETFPVLYLGRASKRVVTLAGTVALIFAALLFNSSKLSFLFDPQLGGRTSMFIVSTHSTLLPSKPLFGFQEVLYASAATELGYAGFVALTLMLLSPVLLLFVDASALQSPTRRAALKGLILYAFLAASDGALNFIPTMAFYWFVYLIYLCGWPSREAVRARVGGSRELTLAEAAH